MNTVRDVHADSHSFRCHWLQSRSWGVFALVRSTLCRWSRHQEGWHSRSLRSLKTWTPLEEKRAVDNVTVVVIGLGTTPL